METDWRCGVVCRAAVALFLMLSLAMSTVEGNYTLEILMLSYENPTHMAQSLETFRHGCCEIDTTTPCRPCDNAFRVCVRDTPTGVADGACDTEQESMLIEHDNDDLTFDTGESVGGLSNPITVSGQMWGRIEVVFTVFDLDLTTAIESSSDVVDKIFIYPDISSPDDSFSPPVVFTGNASYSHLELAFRLVCGPHTYGSDCTFCVPTNDSTGHYTCNNATGEKTCLEGYQGAPDCTECIPADTCSSEGGFCEQPGDCLCLPGFSGEDCSVQVCNNHICNSSSCTREHNFLSITCGQECVNGSCLCRKCPCELECGENSECVTTEEGSTCECTEGYTYNGDVCEVTLSESEGSGGGGGVLVIVVATVGGLVFILIVLVLIAICVFLFRGRKIKKSDDGVAPNPYETPFFRKWRGNGHASNGLSERKFENPLYSERTNSPASPPLPPRPPDHSYATLEEINNPYAHIPGDPVCSSLDEKPPHLELPEPDPLAVANTYDHIGPQSPATGSAALSASPRIENPYLSPVNSATPAPAAPAAPADRSDTLPHSTSDNAMNSSTTLYAHLQ